MDASALVAIVADEPEREHFRDVALTEDKLLWSATACWETVSAVRRIRGLTVAAARHLVERSAALLSLRLVPVGETELTLALDAYQTYGRNSGHPAQLNMGDCFAYACAKANRARLLYKGDDFARTDLA